MFLFSKKTLLLSLVVSLSVWKATWAQDDEANATTTTTSSTTTDEDAPVFDPERNMTKECLEQNALIKEELSAEWSAYEDYVFDKCFNNDDDDEAENYCEESKTGTEVVTTFYMGPAYDSNVSKAYRAACVAASTNNTIHTFAQDVKLSCRADSSSHVPFVVTFEDLFVCLGRSCERENVYHRKVTAFAERIVDESQNGVTCQPYDEVSGAFASFGLFSAAIMTLVGTLFAAAAY